jgi:hypothetical protein
MENESDFIVVKRCQAKKAWLPKIEEEQVQFQFSQPAKYVAVNQGCQKIKRNVRLNVIGPKLQEIFLW